MKPTRIQHLLRGLGFSITVIVLLRIVTAACDQEFGIAYRVLGLLSFAFSLILFRRFDPFARWYFGNAGSIGNAVLVRWIGMVVVLVFLGFGTRTLEHFSPKVLLIWAAVTPLVFVLLHVICRYGLRRSFPRFAIRRRAVIVFVNASSRTLAGRLKLSEDYDVVGYFEDRDVARLGGGLDGLPLLGRSSQVGDYMRISNVDVVFVVLPDEGASRTMQLLEALGDTTASVYYIPDLLTFNLLKSRLGEIEGLPAVEVAETPFYGADGMLKRLFDLSSASLALIFIAPLMLIVALAVKLDSKGPVLFRQRRYGLNGKPFWVFKFRSMTVADRSTEIVQVTRNDARVTRVGRFLRRSSIDELPQLLNVIRGEMTLVGPRPHSVAHNEYYRREVKRYMVRHKVRPGLTGWAQVNGLRGETTQLEDMAKRIQYDLEYIRDWTPLLDVRIILMTIVMVFRDKNAY